jgi:hypothetical protein
LANGQWGGHLVFGDGHVRFTNSFDISDHTLLIDGQSVPDNVFNMQTGFNGDDAILSFTEAMSADTVKLQYD